MGKTFYYFNDPEYPILISSETSHRAPHTFLSNGHMWENLSLQQFFGGIDKTTNYNIVDIGAQVGLYTLFAKYLPESTFYSFEPFSITYNLLNENVKLNNLNNVNTFNLGISDKEGVCVLNTSLSHNGLHTMGDKPLRFNDIEAVNVKTTTLDMFFDEIPVHYIKIDTEGYEYFILKGGKNIIAKYKPIIQLEWNVTNMEQCNVSENMLTDLLGELGYVQIGFVEEEKLFAPK